MNQAHQQDVQAIQSIDAVPHIMQMIADATNLRFVCVARVTDTTWTTCAVLDNIEFNLQPGDELDITTTMCDQVRRSSKPIFIDETATDPVYHDHPVPKMFGIESYFSYPIYSSEGEFFGTLCGLDPLPNKIKTDKLKSMISSFAGLISCQIDSGKRLASMETALLDEQQTAKLREQYIAVLGHDLRTPLSSISMGIELLKEHSEGQAAAVLSKMESSSRRISRLISDVMDFTHGKMGSGIPLTCTTTDKLAYYLKHTVSELASLYPDHSVETDITISGRFFCDPARICQLLSNLLVNALVHGDPAQPVQVSAWLEQDSLHLEVANGGTPIPDSVMRHIFEPFWREAGQRNAKGLGLGLFIAAEIAKAHQGVLTVGSDEHETRFTFRADLTPEHTSTA